MFNMPKKQEEKAVVAKTIENKVFDTKQGVQEKLYPPCGPAELDMADQHRLAFWHTLPDAVPFDEVLKEKYWSNVARKLSQFSSIFVVPVDGTWIAELIVSSAGDQWAKVVLRDKTSLSRTVLDSEIPSGYVIRYSNDPSTKWNVLRTVDNQRIHQGAPDKHTALLWLNGHIAR